VPLGWWSLLPAGPQAGLVATSPPPKGRIDFHGQPTAVFQLGLTSTGAVFQLGSGEAGRTLRLELSEAFDFDKPDLLPDDDGSPGGRGQAAAQSAARVLRDAGRPAGGLRQVSVALPPSTSGADTYIVHGEMHLADGGAHNLHAKVAASVT
jgi:hypothetical protein